MIFLDTSAIYALASSSDVNHAVAARRFSAILTSRERLVVHNYVLVESFALLQSRLGLRSAAAFEKDSRMFDVQWVDDAIHAAAAARWAAGKRTVSFVDHVSFVLMERLGIEQAFAFDGDFESAGFSLYAAG